MLTQLDVLLIILLFLHISKVFLQFNISLQLTDHVKVQPNTALNTAKLVILTRRLVDVSQDVVVTEEDCKTKEFKTVKTEVIGGTEIPLLRQVRGRVLAQDLKNPKGADFVERNTLVTKNCNGYC